MMNLPWIWSVAIATGIGHGSAASAVEMPQLQNRASQVNIQTEAIASVPQTVSLSSFPEWNQLSEQVLAELNRVRTDPQGYANWLETQAAYFDGTTFAPPGQPRWATREGVLALNQAILVLRQTEPLPAFQYSPGMSQAAREHASDLGEMGLTGNVGSDGSYPSDRLLRYGSWEGQAIEAHSYMNTSAEILVMQMVVSDGDRNRRSRSNVLSDAFAVVGAGCQAHIVYQSVCVLGFATDFSDAEPMPFIAASEWDDDLADSSSDGGAVAVAEPTVAPVPSAPAPAIAPEPAASASETDATETAAAPASTYYLTELEAAIVAETNRLRANPAAYAAEMADAIPHYRPDNGRLFREIGAVLSTVEGVAALEEAIEALEDADPLPLLEPSPGISKAAVDHAEDLGDNGIVGHYGSADTTPLQRMNRYGEVIGGWGENISYAPTALNEARWHIQQLLIDDNVPSRAHRDALLNPDYRLIGVSCQPHVALGNVCVMNYSIGYEEAQ